MATRPTIQRRWPQNAEQSRQQAIDLARGGLILGDEARLKLKEQREKIAKRDHPMLTTLDNVERTLTGEMLVIADPKHAIGLAGVMGGANTEISERTVNVFLESANFHPISNRRTARGLGLLRGSENSDGQ